MMESFNGLDIELDQFFSQSKQNKPILDARWGSFSALFVEQLF